MKLTVLALAVALCSASHAGTVYRNRYTILPSGAPCFYRFGGGYNLNLSMVKVASVGVFRDQFWDENAPGTFGRGAYVWGPNYTSFRVVMFDGSTYQEKTEPEKAEKLFLEASEKCRKGQ